MGRFLNADAYASTGQGLLGNNMFAYCLNNPTGNIDVSGTICCSYLVKHNDGGANYITDQNAEPYKSQKLGDYTVGYNGCGAIATFNALLSLGEYAPFSDILAFFNASSSRTFANGKFGILPWQVETFFQSLGYNTAMAYVPEGIEAHSANADACIMFYIFPRHDTLFGIEGDWPGAHFIEYGKSNDGYLAHNTANPGGVFSFTSPSDYGYNSAGYYAVGIFIYK